MSVDQLPPGRASAPQHGAQLVRYDEFIDKQIESTRRMVKTVDVMTALLVMATGTLGFLLAAAIVEHWLVPGGFNLGVRLLLFVALVGSLLFFAARRLWPLVAGSINPAYAAHTIEQDNPSLKNSLLNLLLFRQHRDDVTDAVYETLEEQAARRLTRVPIDTAVDRTQLLRLGYVLVAIVAAVALYKIFSPKDPFITAERVLMPWARIVPPSRVSIDNVEPGAVTLARGEVLTISADVRGIGDDDPVVIKYTTADGQAVDRPAPMTPSSVGLRFTGQLPPASDGTKAGVAQNLRYHIEAGDARSLEYAVTVVAAPTIMVERIEYDYPEYTRFVDRSVERLGDIRAIEGTRVTIHARANGPIEEAAVDFEADGRRDLRMEATDSDARAAFSLGLRDDRRTPRYTSYVLRFTGIDGRPNRDPVKFPIDVTPDNPPEVSITAPAEKSRDVRLDETVAIEVDAIDSDFALGGVRLHGESAGKPVLDEKLLAKEHTGRFRGRLLFTPIEHNLKPGDVVRYWVTARDNRTPTANQTSSDSQTLRIVGGNPRNQNQRKPNQNGESQEGQQQQGEGGQSGAQGADSAQGSEQGESNGHAPQSESAPGESASGSGEQGRTADGTSDQSGEQNSENQSGESSSGESNGDDSSSGQSKPGEQSKPGDQSTGEGQSRSQTQNQPGNQQQQSGESSETGEAGERSDQNQSQKPGGTSSRGNQSQNSPNDSQNQSGEQGGEPREGNSSQQQNGERQSGAGDEPRSDADSSPVSSEGDNDGEAFERIRDFMNREGQLPKEGEEQPSDTPQEQGESQPGKSESGKSESGSSEQGRTADGKDASKSEGAKPSESGEATKDAEQTPDANADSESHPGESTDKPGDQPESSDHSQSPEGQHTSSEGESGAGEQPRQGQGSPESEQPGEQPDQWQQKPSGENEQGDQQEAPSGGRGDRKNDSQAGEGGDRSGGGEEGAGQKSERDGTGSSGQNQSADQGAGESSEQGAGENSKSAGEDAKSNEQTGQSGGNEKGAGSSQKEGQGEQPGGAEKQPGGDQASGDTPQQNPNGEPASAGGEKSENASDSSASPESPNERQNQQQPGNQPGSTNRGEGAGQVPEGVITPSGSSGTAPDADAANLDYARKQTDLVLETLDEQMKRQKVDKRLLDKLGWTEADLKRFLDRWRQLKEAAAQKDNPVADEAQRELDDALRSLGLRRGQLQQSKVSDDTNRDVNQGYRGSIPLEYQERLRAYNQGVSRAQQAEEE